MDNFIVYLDEFGHIGPYISRHDSQHNDSPIFGLGGIVIPLMKAREFSTWFYQRKNTLLKWEVEEWKKSGNHLAIFEKKGSSLYTIQNITKYRELKQFTNRFFNALPKFGANVFYVGVKKNKLSDGNPDGLYGYVLREAIKRLNEHAIQSSAQFIIALDEYSSREKIIITASTSMFGQLNASQLIDIPFQLESKRYQNIQAADWVCGLVGKIGAYWAEPVEWNDMKLMHTMFNDKLQNVAIRSGIRT